jgi:hypothetical protein
LELFNANGKGEPHNNNVLNKLNNKLESNERHVYYNIGWTQSVKPYPDIELERLGERVTLWKPYFELDGLPKYSRRLGVSFSLY